MKNVSLAAKDFLGQSHPALLSAVYEAKHQVNPLSGAEPGKASKQVAFLAKGENSLLCLRANVALWARVGVLKLFRTISEWRRPLLNANRATYVTMHGANSEFRKVGPLHPPSKHTETASE